MKIKWSRSNKQKFFRDLRPGDVFRCLDTLYVKIEDVEAGESRTYNAMMLNGATAFYLSYFGGGLCVEPFPDAVLLVEGTEE